MNTLYKKIDTDIINKMTRPSVLYIISLLFSVSLFSIGMLLWGYQIYKGLGVSGLNHPIGWGVYITNFVFWVGIAHSGTLISAVLFLFKAKFRSRFNRTAEAMTIFAVMTAGLFPLIHLGRTWFFYWLIPYPNQRMIWVNFKSPLIWDVFAVTTYFTVSLVFFYTGLIPDLAIIRDYSSKLKNKIYSVFALGWKGSLNQWKHYNKLYLYLAAFATPLVVSVHSVVSWDFAMSILPGWHTTIFAPYFVAGAIFSGTAMVLTLTIPMRKILNLYDYIKEEHFEKLSLVLLFTSLIVTYSYITEYLISLYSHNYFEKFIFFERAFGNFKYLVYLMIFCNCLMPLLLFIKKLRTNIYFLFILSILVNIGMWFERFVIIVSSLSKDFLSYNWGCYKPTFVEFGITLASFGLFFTLFLLFTKFLPVLSITEIKEEAKE